MDGKYDELAALLHSCEASAVRPTASFVDVVGALERDEMPDGLKLYHGGMSLGIGRSS